MKNLDFNTAKKIVLGSLPRRDGVGVSLIRYIGKIRRHGEHIQTSNGYILVSLKCGEWDFGKNWMDSVKEHEQPTDAEIQKLEETYGTQYDLYHDEYAKGFICEAEGVVFEELFENLKDCMGGLKKLGVSSETIYDNVFGKMMSIAMLNKIAWFFKQVDYPDVRITECVLDDKWKPVVGSSENPLKNKPVLIEALDGSAWVLAMPCMQLGNYSPANLSAVAKLNKLVGTTLPKKNVALF